LGNLHILFCLQKLRCQVGFIYLFACMSFPHVEMQIEIILDIINLFTFHMITTTG
jgi:hypothetical protein